MGIFEILTGGKDYTTVVKEYIKKIFVHEAKKFHCETSDLRLIVYYETDGTIQIGTYFTPGNKVWRMIPDKEIEEILMK